MTRAFVFPGQGSQAVGMGRELAEAFPAAREVFEEVDDALDQKLSRIAFEGPEDLLILTENAQPALMAVSLAATRAIEREGGFDLTDKADCVAGHSLGEYSALTAAGGLRLADAARLLKRRGQAMQRAVPVGDGAMAALLGLDYRTAVAVAEEAAQGDVVAAANDNADGQVVISGARDAVARAVEIARDRGAKRAVLLPVSAPFHCPLMQPAAEEMTEALAGISLTAPRVPLITNVTASAVTAPDEIRALLVAQVCGTVHWRESVLHMRERGVETLVELGAGKVLSGLVRRIDRTVTGSSVATPAGVEALLGTL